MTWTCLKDSIQHLLAQNAPALRLAMNEQQCFFSTFSSSWFCLRTPSSSALRRVWQEKRDRRESSETGLCETLWTGPQAVGRQAPIFQRAENFIQGIKCVGWCTFYPPGRVRSVEQPCRPRALQRPIVLSVLNMVVWETSKDNDSIWTLHLVLLPREIEIQRHVKLYHPRLSWGRNDVSRDESKWNLFKNQY